MNKLFSTLKTPTLERWLAATNSDGVPSEAYAIETRIVRDNSGKSSYCFGAILNSYRFQRPQSKPGDRDCFLCEAVEDMSSEDSIQNLFPEYILLDFVVRPNKFPVTKGASVAISNGIGNNERPMYTTKDLERVATEINEFAKFAKNTGFQFFHNSPGFGASISRHEHWHLTDFGIVYDKLGSTYGFDSADRKPIKGSQVSFMPDFPFAHLIFNEGEPEKIVYLLEKLEKEIGPIFKGVGVPHTLSQGRSGILVVPAKIYKEKGIGSGDVAGHLVFKSQDEFEKADYDSCIKKLSEVLFTKDELNLERFL